jgi:glycosyltransferase involved in cell wall biosynthesis
MPDIVENGVNGVLIPPANGVAIEDAVLRLATSSELRERLGCAAQQTMRRYAWERSACMLEDLFRRVLDREASKRTKA